MKDYRAPETRSEALALLEQHVERDGICEGCLASWARLVAFPCSHAQSARRFLAGAPTAGDPADPAGQE
ncbi:hypothetical protein ACFFX1_12825 [Dactylosporangium sucinum]|uniref:Uncharacterized protein n=1 Tax=Dactylosporangium sucinum TaxID=1424081 RepID=A0A917TWF6_9ACTN|nr:hypothetical protein [Dactylosporangium sucinum]GGM41323.1 hypothetical protein GCM10007977_048390 [Dactylosporangium sucinum]